MKSKISKKGKIIISSLILSLGLSGCSFSLNKDSGVENDSSIAYEDMQDNDKIDSIMEFQDEENKGSIEYTHLIENTDTTRANFVHIIDEKTITNDGKLFDGKKEVSADIFDDETIQPITLPIAFTLFGVDNMADLTDSYGNCEITGKKLLTLDGEIFYYFEGLFTFNSFADKYIDLGINEGDTMTAKSLYRLNADGTLDLLYKSQSGFKEDSPNVLEANYNDVTDKILVDMEDTVFKDMDGEYSVEYLKEALDVYSGTDYYYDSSNDGKDFSKYKKY